MGIKCPVCDAGFLKEMVELITIGNVEVESHYSLCDTCKSEIATSEQVKRNKESNNENNQELPKR